MIFAYGGTKFALGMVSPSLRKTAVRNAAGNTFAFDHTWDLTFHFRSQKPQAAARVDIDSQVSAAYSLFGTDGGNAILYQIDGTTPTAHALYQNSAMGKIRVVDGPHFSQNNRAEGITMRTGEVRIAARILLPTAQRNEIVSFQESLQFLPAGRKRVVTATRNTNPIAQITTQKQVWRASQAGEVVGLTKRPYLYVPPPLWPFAVEDEEPLYTHGRPRRDGDEWFDWPLSYEYQFASEIKLDRRTVEHIWGLNWG